jgi:hypothetical protein
MHERFLAADPAKWLMESRDPSIRYLAMRDILGTAGEGDYEAVAGSPAIRKMTGSGSILGKSASPDIFYHGTVWCFAEAVERGLDRRSPIVSDTAEFLTGTLQDASGGFSFDWNPRTPVACRTGDMVRSLIRAGYDNEAVKSGLRWIRENQRHDGGWLHCPLAGTCDTLKLALLKRPGSGLEREHVRDLSSCFYATLACASALLTGKDPDRGVTDRAMEFFLGRKLFRSRSGEPVRPHRGWNRDFRLLGYPLLCQYDILSGLDLISEAGYRNDERAVEAFNILMQKQDGQGRWRYENPATGMLFRDLKKDNEDAHRWLTLRVLRFFRKAESPGA